MKFILFAFILTCFANNNRPTPQEIIPDAASEQSPEFADGPMLTISSPGQIRKFSRAELLKMPELRKLTVAKDPAYRYKKRTYSAVPLAKLFEGFKAQENIQFKCLDGFSASMSAAHVLNTDPKGSIAYVAVELADDPWPKIPKKTGSAGPYYLIWDHPEKSKISFEEWPFQLSGFEIKGTLAEQYPHVVPDKAAPSDVTKGFNSFVKNCFVCHTVNGEGDAHMGPDLNVPNNPTEYLRPEYFEVLVRKPSNLRTWSESKMSAFPKEVLSDEELAQIVQYLKYMSKHKFGEAVAK